MWRAVSGPIRTSVVETCAIAPPPVFAGATVSTYAAAPPKKPKMGELKKKTGAETGFFFCRSHEEPFLREPTGTRNPPSARKLKSKRARL